MILSDKEQSLLKDQLDHEKVCIQKYQHYAQQASDQQLKQLFQNYAQQEQNHYDTVKQILSGQVPAANQSQAGQSQSSAGQAQSPAGAMSTGMQNLNNRAGETTNSAAMKDAYMCNDMLMTEKYVSGAYDTAIFEFSHANIRQSLNHIQKEEQQHGEGIFNYLQSTGLYNIQS